MHSGAAGDRLRVVLDSNVLVSAFAFPGGALYQVLQALVRGEILVGVPPFILAEVEGVLRDKLRAAKQDIQEALSLLRERCQLIDPPEMVNTLDLSPADNRVLDCAVASQARFLVTGDRGIQRLREFQGVRILSPAAFLEVIIHSRGEQ